MVNFSGAASLILILAFTAMTEAVTPIFLSAITSALASIPFTGGPMTTGLIGAKLGIGTKLLYYLGYFGRGSKPSTPVKPAPKTPKATATPKLPSGLQPMPLPYILSGGGRFQQIGAGFQQMGGGFAGPATFQQMPFGGFDPSQIFQALRAQGYDANTAMQIMNYGGGFGMGSGGGGAFSMNVGGGGFGQNMASFPPNMGGGGFGQNIPNFLSNIGGGEFGQNTPSVPNGMGVGLVPDSTGFSTGTSQGTFPSEFDPVSGGATDVEVNANLEKDGQPHSNVGESSGDNDIESFFTFLQDMDENGCISRLICDIGEDPLFLGDFSENIHGIVGSLEVQPSSRAYPYVQIMESGKEGGCSTKFPQCSDPAYEVVKSIAPSVGVPQNINVEAVNSL